MRKYGFLIFLIVISAKVRFSNLDTRGLFTDEKFTLLNANGIWVGGGNQAEIYEKPFFTPQDFWAEKNIKDYFEAIAHSDFGTHIVYNGILHYWMEMFGNSDYSVRFLSALFSLLTVVIVYLFTMKVFGSYTTSFFSGLFLALDPLNIAQSHIARSYTLSFLLVVLATYFFIKILEKAKNRLYFILYAVLVGLAMLNHYLNFLVPLAHGIVFLFLKEKKRLWPGFIASAAFNVCLMLYWFNWGGGYIAMDFLKDKNEKHLKIAELNAGNASAAVQLSTPGLVAKKTAELFFDSNILSQSLFINLNQGIKNVLVSLLIFGLFLVVYFFSYNRKIYVPAVVAVVVLLTLHFDMMEAIIVANFLFFSLFFAFQYVFTNRKEPALRVQNALVSICMLMLFLPILFVLYDALKNGHTTSLTHRYIGVASPFVAILMAFGVYRFFKFSILAVFLGIFVYFYQTKPVEKEIRDYFEDKSTLNAWFEPARVPNPYHKVAQEILAKYQKNDTVLIPGAYREFYTEVFDSKELVSYNDAQYLNLYFPKNAVIIEKIDKKEPDKVFLKRENGEKLLIFDFEGTKYRY
ncbi:MAG TPA: glycosyltransferase family 39 protein [Leadbetterella sp.]|nr:glycosyltransferase family 39 protein [Leadbetterella sp.]